MPASTTTVDSANTIAADIRLALMGLSDNARSVASAVSHELSIFRTYKLNWTFCTCPLFDVFSGVFARV